MEEEYTVAIYQKGKAFAFKGYKDGTEGISESIWKFRTHTYVSFRNYLQ